MLFGIILGALMTWLIMRTKYGYRPNRPEIRKESPEWLKAEWQTHQPTYSPRHAQNQNGKRSNN